MPYGRNDCNTFKCIYIEIGCGEGREQSQVDKNNVSQMVQGPKLLSLPSCQLGGIDGAPTDL